MYLRKMRDQVFIVQCVSIREQYTGWIGIPSILHIRYTSPYFLVYNYREFIDYTMTDPRIDRSLKDTLIVFVQSFKNYSTPVTFYTSHQFNFFILLVKPPITSLILLISAMNLFYTSKIVLYPV